MERWLTMEQRRNFCQQLTGRDSVFQFMQWLEQTSLKEEFVLLSLLKKGEVQTQHC